MDEKCEGLKTAFQIEHGCHQCFSDNRKMIWI